MSLVFADTSGWLAFANKRDVAHEVAVSVNKSILRNRNMYVTSNYVLDETYTGLLARAGHSAAVDFGEMIRTSESVRVSRVSENVEAEAWELFKKYSDKQFSFTDCTSFVLMQRLRIIEAFASDHHFEQMGFTILLK